MNTCVRKAEHFAILLVAALPSLVPAALGAAHDCSLQTLAQGPHRNGFPLNKDWLGGGGAEATDLHTEIGIETSVLTGQNHTESIGSPSGFSRRMYRDQRPSIVIAPDTPAREFIFEHNADPLRAGRRRAMISHDGFQAVQLDTRIRTMAPPRAISVMQRPKNSVIYHCGEKARSDIDEDELPGGSRVLKRELALWQEYPIELIFVALIIAAQGLFIAVVLLNRVRLRQLRSALQDEHDRRMHSEVVAIKLQAQLERFSKERALGVMTTGIAHEVNQPLVAIQNYAQAARLRLNSDGDHKPKIIELLAKVDEQAVRAGDIVRHVRNLVGDNDPELHPASVRSIIANVVEMMEPELAARDCAVEYRIAAELPPVLVDELEIQLVMVNLLQNAADSVQCLRDSSQRGIVVDVCQIDDQDVQVSVADRGPGVDPDQVENVFEALYTDKAGGMGIGLAICRTLIEAQGGRIWYAPGQSAGAVFSFTLRLAQT